MMTLKTCFLNGYFGLLFSVFVQTHSTQHHNIFISQQLRLICHSPHADNDNHGTNTFCAPEIAVDSQGNLFLGKRNFKIRACVSQSHLPQLHLQKVILNNFDLKRCLKVILSIFLDHILVPHNRIFVLMIPSLAGHNT